MNYADVINEVRNTVEIDVLDRKQTLKDLKKFGIKASEQKSNNRGIIIELLFKEKIVEWLMKNMLLSPKQVLTFYPQLFK